MAERRMFAKSIIDSDMFLDMPATTQNLYFHLSMRADDDGFVNSPQKIMRMVSCSKNDMDMLVFKNFIIPFETGICVIKHWRIHNYLRNDRYTPTIYTEEKSMLTIDESKSYTVGLPLGIPHVIPVGDVGKVSIDKSNKDIKDSGTKVPERTKFVIPLIEEVTTYCQERENNVDPEKWYDHYTSNGWKVGKNPMRDWKAAVRTWERSTSSSTSTVGKNGAAAHHSEPRMRTIEEIQADEEARSLKLIEEMRSSMF